MVGVLAVPGPVQDSRVPVPQPGQVRPDGRVVPLAEPDDRALWRTAAQVPHHVPLGGPVQRRGADARGAGGRRRQRRKQ